MERRGGSNGTPLHLSPLSLCGCALASSVGGTAAAVYRVR